MRIDEIRLFNLHQLISENGSAACVADKSGTAAAYLSQIINGVPLPSGNPRVVGKALARKLEKGCGKSDGWMDIDHSDQRTEQEHDLILKIRELPEHEKLFFHEQITAAYKRNNINK